jgi:hypothetical protein
MEKFKTYFSSDSEKIKGTMTMYWFPNRYKWISDITVSRLFVQKNLQLKKCSSNIMNQCNNLMMLNLHHFDPWSVITLIHNSMMLNLHDFDPWPVITSIPTWRCYNMTLVCKSSHDCMDSEFDDVTISLLWCAIRKIR